MSEEENSKGKEKKERIKDVRKKIEDWMVRISFAEAGEPEKGYEVTGETIKRKIKLAMDKIMLTRSEKMAETQPEAAEQEAVVKPPPVPERPARRERPAGESLQVMIIDDEPIVGKRLQPALSKYGMDVEVFQESTKALARLNEKEFDIVVTDLKMEEVDGLQVLEHIMTTCPDTRVVMITGYGSVEVAREALTKGAFDFVSKPFKPKDLRAIINKAALSMGFEGIDQG